MLRLICWQAQMHSVKTIIKRFYMLFDFLMERHKEEIDLKLGVYIKDPPAFILIPAPLSTCEPRPSETNWASVNKRGLQRLGCSSRSCRTLGWSGGKTWSCCFTGGRCQLHWAWVWKTYSSLAGWVRGGATSFSSPSFNLEVCRLICRDVSSSFVVTEK